MKDHVIQLRNVGIRFRHHVVLHGIDLEVPRGQTLCVIGESGCGKTVLLKLMIGLLRPTTGSVYFDHRDLSTLNEAELTQDADSVWVSCFRWRRCSTACRSTTTWHLVCGSMGGGRRRTIAQSGSGSVAGGGIAAGYRAEEAGRALRRACGSGSGWRGRLRSTRR